MGLEVTRRDPRGRWGFPAGVDLLDHLQCPTALKRFFIGRPVRGLVSRGYVSAITFQLARWINEMNPLHNLFNRAGAKIKVCVSASHALDWARQVATEDLMSDGEH